MSKGRPANLVLIVLDTARADLFAPYGGQAGSSPTFERLAKGGLAQQAFASCSWTLPSHAGLLFGDHHRLLGLTKPHQENVHAAGAVLEPLSTRYLPQVLADNGYWTTGASANPWLQRQSGFAVGFDSFRDLWREGEWNQGIGRRAKIRRLGRHAVLANGDSGLRQAAVVADEWVERAGRDPAPGFLFLNLMEFHAPYLPPRPFNDLCAVNRALTGYQMLTHLDMYALWLANLSGGMPSDRELRRMRHLYRRTAGYVDAWLDRFIGRLREAGIEDNTQVVITSDHGENFGEGGRLGHSFSLNDHLTRVPLFFSKRPAHALPSVLSLTDVPAVLARELELDHVPWQLPEADGPVVTELQGIGEPEDPRIERFISDNGLPPSAVEGMTADRIAATDGRYKVVRHGDRDLLYDTATDPDEVNGTTIHAVIPELRRVADSLLDEIERFLTLTPDQSQVQSETPPPTAREQEDAALAEQMRLLGYL